MRILVTISGLKYWDKFCYVWTRPLEWNVCTYEVYFETVISIFIIWTCFLVTTRPWDELLSKLVFVMVYSHWPEPRHMKLCGMSPTTRPTPRHINATSYSQSWWWVFEAYTVIALVIGLTQCEYIIKTCCQKYHQSSHFVTDTHAHFCLQP